jgi:MerR family transcriptional regulator, thiopeptide resistance regulator
MAYTVKKLAALSGVSVRTLHFYDETALLKPAWYGANGYRFYEEPQLLILQQILFYRELGFELKQIKRILQQPDFEKTVSLKSHRKLLEKNLTRTRQLIDTIDKTIDHLKGRNKMKLEDMFIGFDPEEQVRHENYLVNRFGEPARQVIETSKTKVKDWTRADWEKSGNTFNQICRDLVSAMENKQAPSSPQVQPIIRRHFKWLKNFWTPTRASYTGHSQLIVDSELRKAYEAFHPQLPDFVAAGIRAFAESELE